MQRADRTTRLNPPITTPTFATAHYTCTWSLIDQGFRYKQIFSQAFPCTPFLCLPTLVKPNSPLKFPFYTPIHLLGPPCHTSYRDVTSSSEAQDYICTQFQLKCLSLILDKSAFCGTFQAHGYVWKYGRKSQLFCDHQRRIFCRHKLPRDYKFCAEKVIC